MERILVRARGTAFPELTPRAIRAAVASPVEGLLFDVRLTSDLHWVVPATSDLRTLHTIHTRTRAACARAMLPLDTVLALACATAGKHCIYLDVRDEGETRALVRLIRATGAEERVVAIGWSMRQLEELHAVAPQLRLGLALPQSEGKGTMRVLPRRGVVLTGNAHRTYDGRLRLARDIPARSPVPLWCVHLPVLSCTPGAIRELHAREIRVHAYTVNRQITERLVARAGADAILTGSLRAPRS